MTIFTRHRAAPVALFAIALLLAGCEPAKPIEIAWGVDQCVRREIFQQCLKAAPAGPASIGDENDWDEVIEQCADAARDQAIRHDKHAIKPECL